MIRISSKNTKASVSQSTRWCAKARLDLFSFVKFQNRTLQISNLAQLTIRSNFMTTYYKLQSARTGWSLTSIRHRLRKSNQLKTSMRLCNQTLLSTLVLWWQSVTIIEILSAQIALDAVNSTQMSSKTSSLKWRRIVISMADESTRFQVCFIAHFPRSTVGRSNLS